MEYLVGLMLGLSCVACRAASDDADPDPVQPASLAGAGGFETSKAASVVASAPARSAVHSDDVVPAPTRMSHLDYCDEGFRTTLNARVDLVRLGALCGPSNGLVRQGGATRRLLAGAQGSGREPLPLDDSASSACGRLAVGFVPSAEGELIVELRSRTGSLAECRLSQSGFCPLRELACGASTVAMHWAPRASTAEPNTHTQPEEAVLIINSEWWALPGPLADRKAP